MMTEQEKQGTTAQDKIVVKAPSGKLGLHLADCHGCDKGVVVSKVNDSSPLAGKLLRGDKIVIINGVDVHEADVDDVLVVLRQQSDVEKDITILRAVPSSNKPNSNHKKPKMKMESVPPEIVHSLNSHKNEIHSSEASDFLPYRIVKQEANPNGKKHKMKLDTPLYSCVESGPPLPTDMMAFDDSMTRKKQDHAPSRGHGISGHNKHKKNRLETSSESEAPPMPIEMVYDDSAAKKKHEHSHVASSHKTDHAHMTSSRKHRKKTIHVESSPEIDPPLPIEMTFDNSMVKKGHGKHSPPKTMRGHSNSSGSSPSLSCEMTHAQPDSCHDEVELKEEDDNSGEDIFHAPGIVNSTRPHHNAGGATTVCSSENYSDSNYNPAGSPIVTACQPISIFGTSEEGTTLIEGGYPQAMRNNDIEEGVLSLDMSPNVLADAVLVNNDENIMEAEVIRDSQQLTNHQVIFNLTPTSLQKQDADDGFQRQNRWLICSIVVFGIILLASVLAGILVSLQGNGNDKNSNTVVGVDVTNAVTLMTPMTATSVLADTYYCGVNWDAVGANCASSVPCPSGSKSECPIGEQCIAFTNCGKFQFKPDPTVEGGGPDVEAIKSTFFCSNSTKKLSDKTMKCDGVEPCPNGPSDCLGENQGCFAFTVCNEDVDPDSIVQLRDTPSSTSTSTTSSSSIHSATTPTTTETPTTSMPAFQTTVATTASFVISTSASDVTTTSSFSATRDFGNDLCSAAISVTSIPEFRTGSTVDATSDFTSVLVDTCGATLDSKGVWYRLESKKQRIVRVEYQLFSNVYGKSYLSVFTGPCENLICYGYAEGASPDWLPGPNQLIVFEFQAEERSYSFLLTGETAETVGEYEFRVNEYEVPVNDNCIGAIDLDMNSLPLIVDGSTTGAMNDFDDSSYDTCGAVNLDSRGVWHSLIGRGAIVRVEYQLYTYGYGKSRISIFTGSCGNLICKDYVEGNGPDWVPENAELAVYEFFAEEGETYSILLSGETFSTVGEYELKVDEYKIPENDDCENAVDLDVSMLPMIKTGSTSGAIRGFGSSSVDTCGIVNLESRGVWFRLVGGGTMIRIEYQLYTYGYGKSHFSIFTGSCDNLRCKDYVEGNGPSLVPENAELVVHEFLAEEGETYLFLLSGELFGTAGDFTFKVSSYNLPTNDKCTSSTSISYDTLPFVGRGSTFGATTDFNEFDAICGISADARGVWYNFLGNGKRTSVSYSMPTEGHISLFKGPCNNLTCVRDYEGSSLFEFVAERGTNYRFLLTGYNFFAVGDYEFKLIQYEPPENDVCNSAFLIDEFPFNHNGDLKGATLDFQTDTQLCGIEGWEGFQWGVWFKFMGTGSALSIELKTIVGDGNFWSQVLLFKGTCGGLVCIVGSEGSGTNAIAYLETETPTTPEVTYWVFIAGYDSIYEDKIPFQLNVNVLS